MGTEKSCSLKPSFLLVLLMSYTMDTISGYSMEDLDRLLRNKSENYNGMVRPQYDQSEPLTIQLMFEMKAIRDFDEVAERFSVLGLLYMRWKDDRMPWKPKDFGGLTDFIIERNDFWTPTVILMNAFEKMEKIGRDRYWPMRFDFRGNILYHPGELFTAKCSVNVELYPWDIQTCVLLFSVWGHMRSEINLQTFGVYLTSKYNVFSGNGEWDLIKTETEIQDDNDYAVKFTIKRKPLFILLNTLIPVIFLSILNIMAFLIPIDCGERISYCITVLLALAVFMTLIGEEMPKSATTVAILCYYIVGVLALSMLITFAAIIAKRIHSRGETEKVPNYWTAFVRLTRCRCIRMGLMRGKLINTRAIARFNKVDTNISENRMTRGQNNNMSRNEFQCEEDNISSTKACIFNIEKSMDTSGDMMETPQTDKGTAILHEANGEQGLTFQMMNTILERHRDVQTEEGDNDVDIITWTDVSSSLDSVLGVFSTICLAVITGLFFVYTNI